LITVGLKSEGVVPETTFRSNVSVWLGAPVMKTKITFFAVFCIVTGFESITTPAGAGLPTIKFAVTPAPRMWKSWRRLK
jgi:hypothetical protein